MQWNMGLQEQGLVKSSRLDYADKLVNAQSWQQLSACDLLSMCWEQIRLSQVQDKKQMGYVCSCICRTKSRQGYCTS